MNQLRMKEKNTHTCTHKRQTDRKRHKERILRLPLNHKAILSITFLFYKPDKNICEYMCIGVCLCVCEVFCCLI